MPDPAPLLELRDLRKRFGGLAVTDGVSFSVRAGEIHAVIGPNGAGKSTLIAQVAGTLRPDAGSIHLAGEDVTGWTVPRRARAGLARTFQVTSVLPGFSALENVATAAQARAGSSFRPFGRVAAERGLNDRALAALGRVGLASRAAVPAGTMSHGEKRRLELAIALAAEPRLLLLDEPLAGTGAEDTEHLVSLLDGLRQGHAVLLVEHDMRAVFALADRITVLAYGRVIATGGPAEIRAHPEVRAAYLGEDELA